LTDLYVQVGLRSELCINLLLCDSLGWSSFTFCVTHWTWTHFGDCCYAFVSFSSVLSTSCVSSLNMLLGCAQYRSFNATLFSVVILSVGHFNCTVCLKKVPVLKQVSVQHWTAGDVRWLWSRVVFQWDCKTKPPFLCKVWLAVVFMKVIMFVHWLFCYMQVIHQSQKLVIIFFCKEV